MRRLSPMSRLACSLAAAVLAFTAAIAQAQPAPASATIPIVDCDGLPCINLTFAGGVQGRFALDTGDPHSILDAAFAKSIHADIQPYKTPEGKEYPGISVAKVSGVMFGSLSLGDMKFLVADFGAAMSGQDTLHLNGSLGIPAYADRLLTVDYPAHTVTLSAPLTAPIACPSSCGSLANIKFGNNGPPILVATSGFSVNGKPVSLQVDTMYSGTIIIYDASIEKLGLADLAHGATTKEHFTHTDGGVDMLRATAQSESFGGVTLAKDAALYFPSTGVHQPDGLFDGTVGAALLKNFRVTFDFFDHKIWIG